MSLYSGKIQPSARALFLALGLFFFTVFAEASRSSAPALLVVVVRGAKDTPLSMPRCCGCHAGCKATCANCKCAKAGTPCVNCNLSFEGKCSNPHGSTPPERRADLVSIECPFPGCSQGKGGRKVSKRLEDISRLRNHVNEHCLSAPFAPSSEWLVRALSRICPECSVCVTSAELSCANCRSQPVPRITAPKADLLPELEHLVIDKVSLALDLDAVQAGLLPFVPSSVSAASSGPSGFSSESVVLGSVVIESSQSASPPRAYFSVCNKRVGEFCDCGETTCDGRPVSIGLSSSACSLESVLSSNSAPVSGSQLDV